MSRRLTRAAVLAAALLPALLVSCSSTAPTPEARRYIATRFAVTAPSSAPADWLAGGAVFDVSIAESSTTSGRLFVPAALADGAAIDADLAGVAFVDAAGRLQFVFRPADLFVESLRFQRVGQTFTADTVTTDGVRVALTLTRQR